MRLGVRRNQGRGRHHEVLRRTGAAEVIALRNTHARSTCEIVEPARTKVSVRGMRHDGALHQGRPGRRPVPRGRNGGAAAAQAPLLRLALFSMRPLSRTHVLTPLALVFATAPNTAKGRLASRPHPCVIPASDPATPRRRSRPCAVRPRGRSCAPAARRRRA